MKTAWGKPVHVIPFIRTLLVVLAVAACTGAADDLEALRKKAEAGDSEAQRDVFPQHVGLAHADEVPALVHLRIGIPVAEVVDPFGALGDRVVNGHVVFRGGRRTLHRVAGVHASPDHHVGGARRRRSVHARICINTVFKL